ncbi:MAG: hypothetical protein JWO05_3799 [Gemmatimonadetes bacterium]|nr:hypothetical protein [Gemmatimonadota bacterium]
MVPFVHPALAIPPILLPLIPVAMVLVVVFFPVWLAALAIIGILWGIALALDWMLGLVKVQRRLAPGPRYWFTWVWTIGGLRKKKG